MKRSTFMRDAARQLRQDSTEAERILWRALRNRQLNNWKFRRQYPMGPFVLDFYCHELKMAVELDGAHHGVGEQGYFDHQRDMALLEEGIHVLRISNRRVLEDLDGSLELIEEMAKVFSAANFEFSVRQL